MKCQMILRYFHTFSHKNNIRWHCRTPFQKQTHLKSPQVSTRFGIFIVVLNLNTETFQ